MSKIVAVVGNGLAELFGAAHKGTAGCVRVISFGRVGTETLVPTIIHVTMVHPQSESCTLLSVQGRVRLDE